MLISGFARMNEVVVLNLICEFGFVRLTCDVTDGREQNGRRHQPLLAVNEMKRCVLARLRETRHEHEEPHEVVAALLGFLNLLQAVPVFRPLRHFPAVIALEHRNYVLAGRVQDFAKGLDGRLHRVPLLSQNSQ